MSNSEIGLSHTLPRKTRVVPANTTKQETGRTRFKEHGSFYVDNKPAGGDSPGIATTKSHCFGLFGEPPKARFNDTHTRTWAVTKNDRVYGMANTQSEFLKQMYNKERQRREHNEDQAKILRRHRTTNMRRGEQLRRRPLKNRRAIAEQTNRRNFYQKTYDRTRLKTAPAEHHGRHIRGVAEEALHQRFTWQKAFSPVTSDHFSKPEMNAVHLTSIQKVNPRRGKAVGYWNKPHLHLKLRSPNYTASGGTVATCFD